MGNNASDGNHSSYRCLSYNHQNARISLAAIRFMGSCYRRNPRNLNQCFERKIILTEPLSIDLKPAGDAQSPVGFLNLINLLIGTGLAWFTIPGAHPKTINL